ncbi:MAG TPA: hypothetical protein VJB91_00510, partial [Patescibacteria group bacterium]|nr:hypothetical protein [Patescibacteria group bacterium]
MKEKLLTFFQKYVLFWGVVLLFVAIPLYPKLPVFSIKGTYVPIRAEDFLIAFLLTLWIILFLFKRVRLTFDVFFKSVAIYFVVGLISLLSALFLTHTVVPHLGFLHFLRRIEYFSVLLLVVTTITTQKRMFVSLITLFLTTVGVIIYGIGQQYFSWPVISTMNEEFSKGLILHLTEGARVNSTFAGHYDLAAFLVLVLAVLAATVILAKKRWQKVSLVFLGIASYWLLLETASRISFGAYIVAIFLVLFLANTKWQKLWVVPVIGLSVLGLFYSDELSQRFSSTIPKNVNFKQVIERFLPRRQVSVTPSEQPTV